MVKKWFSVRNTVITINISVSKFAKQLAKAISLLNMIRGGEMVSLSDSQKEYITKIRITWHEILILIIYDMLILFAVALVVKMVKHIYRM